ncbi:hypothetical protein N0V93_009023 [Gnomoniopsis smithogilvyi]|uniref:37S ribosomal protein S35, mitochondrial n=1 Tax=Gnomoniopsis smithogilvyi TaxID=1191159 RepID=A0A9W8YKB2_9PEZI|nr:hypothetical protein N0V93_009023 [Gnomoniopsis smithogilvyi]
MPPRLPLPSAELASMTSSGSSLPARISPLELALRTCQSCRSFSTTPSRNGTLPAVRYRFYQWQKKRGKSLAQHRPGKLNYISSGDNGTIPFPSNKFFQSQPVLSEASRELIHRRVSMDDEPIKVVSADLGVDHRRVAAVVRMKEIEKDWERMGKKLAKPYSRAVMEMLPTHDYPEGHDPLPLEPINEIHVHGYTMQQLFIPTSESRHFTREDAAQAFHPTMLSPDSRMPHKELVRHYRRIEDGQRASDSREKFIKEARASERADVLRDASKMEFEKRATQTVPTERADFRFKRITADDAGPDGRSRRGVGWRYGAPYEDRKKDQVKHPLKYE